MRHLLALALVLAAPSTPLRASAPQDSPAALIEKLKSADKDEAENARRDLLKAGEAALPPLRDALAKAGDGPTKKQLTVMVERLETRKAVAGAAAKWGDRWCSVFMNSLKVGWAHLKTEEKDGKILLTDEVLFQQTKDASVTVKTHVVCEKDEFLTPAEITLHVSAPDNTVDFAGQAKDGRMVVKGGGLTVAHKMRPEFMVDFAVLRLVTVLPRTEDYSFDLLELVKPQQPKPATLKFDREESIEFGGRSVKTRRFLLSDGEQERLYWVDAEGRLLRMQAGAVDVFLSDEKSARDIDTKD